MSVQNEVSAEREPELSPVKRALLEKRLGGPLPRAVAQSREME